MTAPTQPPAGAGLPRALTYRQLDYWCGKGYLHVESHGSGSQREWPPTEVAIAGLMALLTRVGLQLATAAEVARIMVEGELGIVDLGEGVHLILIAPPGLPQLQATDRPAAEGAA
jgi:hypothetical protein